MNEDSPTSLQTIVEKEPFVILDSSALILDIPYEQESQGFIHALYLSQDIVDIKKEIELAILHYESIQALLKTNSTHVTKEVFLEVDRGIVIEHAILQRKREERTISDEHELRKKTDSRRLYCREISGDLQNELAKTRALLKQTILSFNQQTTYKLLLNFFKSLAPIVKSRSKTNRELEARGVNQQYLAGDESISAAVFYFVLTQQHTKNTTRDTNKRRISVITQDQDIKREIRLAYHLFRALSPTNFKTLVENNPLRVYASKNKQDGWEYAPLFDTTQKNLVGSLDQERKYGGCEPINKLLPLAELVLDTIT